MTSDKPRITATIKFRGVTIEDMTVEELRQLRDVLNDIVGEKVKVVEREVIRDHYPWYRPIWAVSRTWAGNTTGKIALGNSIGDSLPQGHYTIACQS